MQRKRLSIAMVAVAVGSLFAASASAVFAQMTPQTADMSVTGTIVPAACSASFSGSGEVDFGTIRLIDLPASSFYSLGYRDTELLVSCTSNKTVIFTLQDMQSATKVTDAAMNTAVGAPAGALYLAGLGAATVDGASVNLGAYAVSVPPSRSPTVNATARTAVMRSGSTGTWSGGLTHYRTDPSMTFSAGVAGGAATAGTEFVFPLRITAALNYGSRLQVAADTPLNGQIVFAITYQ